MRISETITYEAAPDAVYAMAIDPAFQDRKCLDAGAERHEVAVTPTAAGARVVTKRSLPTDGLPDIAKSLVGSNLTITETVEWLGDQGDGSRDGTLVVEASGAPVAMRGTVQMRPTATGTTVVINGDLKASIPLIGGKIEKSAAPAFIDAIRSENVTGTAWLAEKA